MKPSSNCRKTITGYGRIFIIPLCFWGFTKCSNNNPPLSPKQTSDIPISQAANFDSPGKTIHVLVALCDNKYQGIVPVNAKVGNGQDPVNNLYWGWGYGVKTHFKKSREWKFIKSVKSTYPILERLLFQSTTTGFYLVADAYDGRAMKQCIEKYLQSAAGINKDTLIHEKDTIGLNGNAQLLAFIGHNGLMDFRLQEEFRNTDNRKRDCIILACYSKPYFAPFIKQAGAKPILWTSNLMGPEAYTLHDALTGYMKEESLQEIQTRAATAYSRYTKCSLKAAKKLLISGDNGN